MKKVIVTGKNGGLSVKTAEYLKEKGGFEVEQISLRGEGWKNFDFSAFDCVVHIAGITPQNAKSEKDYHNINCRLTKALAEKCARDGVKQFIYISSMAVFGVSQTINPDEGTVFDVNDCRPDSEYGKSKLLAEQAINGIVNNSFNAAIIRVPSIYGKDKTEYLDQYKYLAEKLPFIPVAFNKNYKSIIYIENLCELIRLIADSGRGGIFCPDDGRISAADICSAIYPGKKRFRLFGKLMELFMSKNARIIDYYGAVCYDERLTDIFDGSYRKYNLEEAVRLSYE